MPLTPEQIAERQSGIGGSEAAVVCGISKWSTPVKLWMQKRGDIPPDFEETELMRWGNLLERVIAEEWARRNDVELLESDETYRDKEHEFMLAHCDFDIKGRREGLEVKNASSWTYAQWGDEDTDNVPLFYLTQVIHYMRVRDFDAYNFAVLLGGNELKSYRVERNLEAEKALIDIEARFWMDVKTGTAPAPIDLKDLVRLWPQAGGAIVATEAVAKDVAELVRMKEAAKAHATRIDELKLRIGEYMKEHEILLDPTDPEIVLVTHKTQNRKAYEVKASSTRVMRTK